MKLLLIGLDGLRADFAIPDLVAADPLFSKPDHLADPRFSSGGADHTLSVEQVKKYGVLAPTLTRLATGDDQSEGKVIPVWMSPPTDSGPGWSSLMTGSTHEECNVWWNEFVGHQLAIRPDILSRVYFSNPAARTFVAATWDAFAVASGPGPIIQQRVDQQRTGQHKVFFPDLSKGLSNADSSVAQWATWHLLHEGPEAAVVYFEGVDEAAHQSGAESEAYCNAIRKIDELTRHLVKAVAERYEQLGEEWLIAVTTDHGHKPEGGHGEDEVEVRRSFLITHRVGGKLPKPISDAKVLRSEQVMWLLLEAIGAKQGSLAASEVGVLRDIEPIGPTRNLAFEW